jgi:hypothetical protein
VDHRAGAEILTPTGIQSPDRPVRRESLHRLRYCGPPKYRTYRTITGSASTTVKVLSPSVRPSVRPCAHNPQTATRIFMTSDFVEFYDKFYSHVNFASKSSKHDRHFT